MYFCGFAIDYRMWRRCWCNVVRWLPWRYRSLFFSFFRFVIILCVSIVFVPLGGFFSSQPSRSLKLTFSRPIKSALDVKKKEKRNAFLHSLKPMKENLIAKIWYYEGNNLFNRINLEHAEDYFQWLRQIQ